MDLLDVLAVCIFFIGRSAPVMGDGFRKEFSKLEDLCGFSQPMLSLWQCQQQCQKTRRDVVHILGTHKPVVIIKSPDKPNLAYSVHEKSEMEEVLI